MIEEKTNMLLNWIFLETHIIVDSNKGFQSCNYERFPMGILHGIFKNINNSFV